MDAPPLEESLMAMSRSNPNQSLGHDNWCPDGVSYSGFASPMGEHPTSPKPQIGLQDTLLDKYLCGEFELPDINILEAFIQAPIEAYQDSDWVEWAPDSNKSWDQDHNYEDY